MSTLFIICGLSFAGKSTLGNAIREYLDGVKSDVDDIKFELYGPDIQDYELSKAQWKGIYEESYHRIEQHLRNGENIVRDSGNFTRRERADVREIASKLGLATITIFVDTPPEIAHQRLLANRAAQTRLDVTDEDWQEIIDVMEPPTAEERPLIFRYGDAIGDWIELNLHAFK